MSTRLSKPADRLPMTKVQVAFAQFTPSHFLPA
jgi:hypothetical protein